MFTITQNYILTVYTLVQVMYNDASLSNGKKKLLDLAVPAVFKFCMQKLKSNICTWLGYGINLQQQSLDFLTF